MTKTNANTRNPFYYVTFFLLMTILLYMCSFNKVAITWDDIWNYHYIQGLTNGLLPYKELSIIITPLYHYIGAIFFTIFGTCFFTFEALGALVNAGILTIVLAILKLYTKNKYVHILTIFFISLLFLGFSSFNYNYLMMLFPFSILYLEKKYQTNVEKRNIKIDFFVGILLALMILSKQTIGLVFSFAFFVYYWVNLTKKNGSFSLKGLFACMVGGSIPLLAFLLFLIFNNIGLNFINYCFGTIIEFGSKNTNAESSAPALFVVIFQVLLLVISNSYRKSTMNLLFGLFSLASLLIAYPLANTYHLCLALLIPTLSIVTSICDIVSNFEFEKQAKYKKVSIIMAICSITAFICSYTSKALPMIKKEMPLLFNNEFSVFNGTSTLIKNDIKKIETVHNYINDKKDEGYYVLILSSDAGLYEIPYNEWHLDYDLLLNGNMGYDGTNRIIDELSQIKKPLFLKNTLGKCNAQESKEIEEYITNNFDEADKICDFRVFVSRGDINFESK